MIKGSKLSFLVVSLSIAGLMLAPAFGAHILTIGQTVTYTSGMVSTSYTFLGYVTNSQSRIDDCVAHQANCASSVVGSGGIGTTGPSSDSEANLLSLFGIDTDEHFRSQTDNGVATSHPDFVVAPPADGDNTASLITYNGSGIVRYIVLKADGWWALFELQDPLDTPGEQAYISNEDMPVAAGISHLTFYGTPEPGTLLMLGLGLLGLGVLAGRKN